MKSRIFLYSQISQHFLKDHFQSHSAIQSIHVCIILPNKFKLLFSVSTLDKHKNNISIMFSKLFFTVWGLTRSLLIVSLCCTLFSYNDLMALESATLVYFNRITSNIHMTAVDADFQVIWLKFAVHLVGNPLQRQQLLNKFSICNRNERDSFNCQGAKKHSVTEDGKPKKTCLKQLNKMLMGL